MKPMPYIRWIQQMCCLSLLIGIAGEAGTEGQHSRKDEPAPAGTHSADTDAYFRDRQQSLPLATRPEVSEVNHFTIFHDQSKYSAHPRQCPFKYLGGNEIIMGFTRATTVNGGDTYEDPGASWLDERESVVYDSSMPMDEKRAFLSRAGSEREEFDMFRPESLFHFGRAFLLEAEKETSLGQMGVVAVPESSHQPTKA